MSESGHCVSRLSHTTQLRFTRCRNKPEEEIRFLLLPAKRKEQILGSSSPGSAKIHTVNWTPLHLPPLFFSFFTFGFLWRRCVSDRCPNGEGGSVSAVGAARPAVVAAVSPPSLASPAGRWESLVQVASLPRVTALRQVRCWAVCYWVRLTGFVFVFTPTHKAFVVPDHL